MPFLPYIAWPGVLSQQGQVANTGAMCREGESS